MSASLGTWSIPEIAWFVGLPAIGVAFTMMSVRERSRGARQSAWRYLAIALGILTACAIITLSSA